jgi:hypothetical protein
MKNAAAIVVLLTALIAPPALAGDGLAPGSLAPPPPAETAAEAPPAAAPELALDRCDNCPPPRKYDSREVIKTRHDLHHTIKTINSYEMAEPKRVERGGIRVRSDVTLVNFVVHRYRVIEAPALVDASEVRESYPPVVHRPKRLCRHGRHGSRYGACRPLHVRG